ncbi:MAG TPA: SRPBCC family protein [Nocardioides sp.]|uniref:SRPBCC family protein n=1 Tax=Nocardioides sp. TaxID=35761 RepID=UPI002E30946F|nr:SRPBCC family protein [Nocardioides sp.]HEX5087856.1 SRPBCC family protein [Nocardioides sp.]
MERRLGGTVAFAVPAEVAFDYLVDPRNRPEWQSSLRRVEDVDGEPRAGQSWTDVTWPGLRPAMRTEVFDRPWRWAESGTWRSVRAELALLFDPTGEQACDVRFDFRIRVLGPVGLAVSALSVPAVRADLRRAARILSSRA